ncbi:Arylsulfatase A [Lutibacter agarilyticus]|uniref:Arylsulfatase A n=1 Tax=Lutibacter agarilyticus TaxID=1109740 RepID=A0A238Z0Q2_9FLAO|nr:sulfatase [Lutibacter agarilyticus]SNR76947.1 Arylsulfatase A [Lutibacter agarilyticus]
MTKNSFYIAILILLVSFQTKIIAQKKEVKKPNIIFILTDDQRWDAIGYVGNELAYTPEMDKLAKSGAFFNNTIATTPICAASRASIFSGLQERTHGYTFQTGPMKTEYMQQAYPKILKEAGYYTAFFGKFGVKYKNTAELYDEFDDYDLLYSKKDKSSYYYKTIDKDTVHLTRYTGYQALNFLDNVSSEQPFCLQLSFSAPHASDNTTEQYFWQEPSNHVLENTTVPEANISSDSDYEKLPQIVKDGFNRYRWHWRYDTPEKYQYNVKGYYRMIAGIDYEIEKIRKKLDEKQLADNTVIILMGDNGQILGERQIAGKWLMYENSIKVPLIIYDPRVGNPHEIDEMALNIDIPSTILDLAGIERPTSWHGQSLVPFINNKNASLKRDTILIEHLWEFENIPPSEGVRTNKWKYFRYVNDKSVEELYNLEEDPMEVNNLVMDKKYHKELLNLRAKCEELIVKYRDPYSGTPSGLTTKISNRKPTFNWVVPTEATSQTGYQILVASSKENIENNIGDVWNSKRINENTSTNILFKGRSFLLNRTYFWKVRVWDVDKRTGIYSEPQSFEIK